MATVSVSGVGAVEVGPHSVAEFEDNYEARQVNVVLFPERSVVACFPLTKRGRGRAWDVAHDINAFIRTLSAPVAPAMPLAKPKTAAEMATELWG